VAFPLYPVDGETYLSPAGVLYTYVAGDIKWVISPLLITGPQVSIGETGIPGITGAEGVTGPQALFFHTDGGSASTIYLPAQHVDGGGA
jgi:hypothetical protein